MSAKYIMLECNRLRSLEIQQREQNDIYKNKWSNVVSSSGIVINKGDVIIFPSIFIFPHEVKKILKKERYSFVLWAY